MAVQRFQQCEMSRPADGGGVELLVSWIPQRIAVAGAVVRLKDPETGQWQYGWNVDRVGPLVLDGQVLERQSRDHLRTRRASDV